ncbi:MAG: serine acetyltransferase [Bacteroidota bacterium]
MQKTPLRFLAKLIYYLNFFLFNSAVPPEVKIGKGSRFAYGGIGVVMNKRAEIGEDCIIGQGITIGGRGQDRAGIVKIGNGVFIGAGARILGTVSVGDNAVIAPNSVVIKDVAAGTIVGGVPARFIRDGITKENQKMYV